MSRRRRLRKLKPLKVLISGKKVCEVTSAKEYERLLEKVDRSKHKVRLK